MAKKGSKKELSQRHEQHVAEIYGGARSASSGGSVTDEGDVRVILDNTLFECKAKLGELAGQKPVRSTLLSQFEKVSDEAYAINREPAMALRFYAPESLLADTHGWVDLVVRLLDDDSHRSFLLDLSHSERAARCREQGRWR